MSSVAEKLQRKSQKATATKQVRLKLVYVQIVVSFLLWMVLSSTGIFGQLTNVLRDILNQPTFSVMDSFSLSKVMVFAGIVALLSVVVGTALGAIAAIIYNLSVRLTGGLLVGFKNN